MQSRVAIEKQFRFIRTGLFVGWAILSAIIVAWSVRSSMERAHSDVMQKAGETLAVQTEILSGVLDKYRLMPPLLSRQSSIRTLFVRDAGGNAQTIDARRTAEEIAGMSAARDVAFFFPDGELLANARGSSAKSAVARPDLIEVARQGQLGRAALSYGGDDRTYAFSSGVRRDGKFVGVVIVYVDFYRVEAAWALSARRIFVTDKAGTVFLANEPDWRLKALSDLREIGQPARYLIEGGFEERLDLMHRLPLLEWDLHVLADPSPVETARITAASIATLACLLAGMIVLVLLRRNEVAILRTRTDRATALRLERVVRDRTRALSVTNRSLSHEVEVRREAEHRLRKTQDELVQTAKLAALGQMSAALSHEYNQPLAAIRTYADNALRFLERGATSEVSGNLSRINGLVERMAELSRTLLAFSRKPGATVGPVPLGTIIDEALLLARPRARAAGITNIHVGPAVTDLYVQGGRIRLGQVFVNLVNNAIDALAGTVDASVEIDARREGDRVVVTVTDNGPGIEPEELPKVFDPFFTTKGIGEGIGIGLSIVDNIIRDFGGTIVASNRPEGGACFTVNLCAASASHDTPDANRDTVHTAQSV
ncbi:signal transduction histidine kinase regulating C4-dicarboxylate transport system [Hoeflea sp. IMCC20628]|uniref:sensor histidine kinase n=1 Tax=Hoeflea sp. IMCC20628 TaxID=1620421 RepID=UPI00063AF61F|nr:ATP-binding protein [Hoeflea sp. IMCC20628]AKH99023.1 signal transduction histidine kinase regulating C4-dicarboxylate transport system [Hoeflea sp. IMCC20628]